MAVVGSKGGGRGGKNPLEISEQNKQLMKQSETGGLCSSLWPVLQEGAQLSLMVFQTLYIQLGNAPQVLS